VFLRLRLCVLCVLCGSSLACAGSGASQVAGGGGAELAGPAAISPSGPAAELYSTQPEPAVGTDPLAGQIVAEIDAGRRKRGHTSVERDGRLDRVALDVAVATGGRQAPAPDAVAFLLWHYGVVEPEPNLFLLRGDDGAEAAALAALQPQLAGAPASSGWRRMGVGVARPAGKWIAVIVLQENNLDVDPLARAIAPGGRVSIRGHIRPLLHSPVVLVTPPQGAVERPTTTVARDTYSARLACKAGSGAYQVEISAQDARGPRVLANFPVYCGVKPPASFVFTAASASSSLHPGEIEGQLLDSLDRDRRANGLPALVRDARLAAIAQRYSQEMAETGEVAHVSSRTGTVVDRVRSAGVAPAPTLIAENVGSAASAADAERAFMGSPGHRENILHPAVTHVGVGVAAGQYQAGGAPLFFTQIFAGWGK
jgi:hypothetical protein